MQVRLHFQLQRTIGIRDDVARRDPRQRHRDGALSAAGPPAHHDICRQDEDAARRRPLSAGEDLHRRKLLLPVGLGPDILAQQLGGDSMLEFWLEKQIEIPF